MQTHFTRQPKGTGDQLREGRTVNFTGASGLEEVGTISNVRDDRGPVVRVGVWRDNEHEMVSADDILTIYIGKERC